jgi:hypothetical protein
MKQISIVLSIGMLLMLTFNAMAQDTTACKVLKEEIAARYKGGCKKGLAHGKGVATGIDRYEGRFKNGLPHGVGIYKWITGEIYEGEFKEGKRQGKGTYTFKFKGRDSTYNGLWKDDILTKVVYPPKYVVEQNLNVTRYTVQRMNSGKRVLFSFKQNGSENSSLMEFNLIANSGSSASLGSSRGFENVEFPVTCRLTYTTLTPMKSATIRVQFEITINEPGDWLITIHN